jgi:poly(hydroxyalkanoate) depolymerase family esterase
MNRLVPSLVLILALSTMNGFAQGQTVNLNYKVAGVDRQTILYAPSGLGANPPLVYVIHGFNMSGQQEVQLTQMNKVADTGKFVVVYPNALKNAGNQQSWDMTGPNDYAYLLSLIDTAEGRYKIDRKRVYVSGFSMGGFLSFNLGCRYADVIAAIAPVSGLLRGECALKRPLPTLFTYGTNEGFDLNTFIEAGEKWVELNGCSPTPKVTRPYPPGNPNSVVTRLEYSGCKDGVPVTIDTVSGGTHEWPMDTRTKVNNSVEVWNFFKTHSLPSAAPVRTIDGVAGNSRSATYSNGIVSLRGLDGIASIRIMDYHGRVIAAVPVEQGRFRFTGHPSGMYQALAESQGESSTFRFVVP